MRLSLMQKFVGLFLLLVVTGGIVATMTYQTLGGSRNEVAAAKHLNDLALQSRIAVSEMGSAMRGYLLDPSDKSQEEKKMAADDKNSKVLAEMLEVSTNQDLRKQIADLKTLDDDELNPSENKVLELVNQGKISEAQAVFVKEYVPLRKRYDVMSENLAVKADRVSQGKIDEVNKGIREALFMILATLAGGVLALGATILWMGFSLRSVFNEAAVRLSQAATAVRDSAAGIAEKSKGVSTSTTEQASALQQTAAAIEQVSATVAKSATHTQESSNLALESSQKAKEGKNVVNGMLSSISQITESNQTIMGQIEEGNKEIYGVVSLINDIGEKTKVINDIVFQTKLLSFNASVEAARAGEHGKGFAVVAEEVGNLAQMSGRSAKEISDLLNGSVQKVGGIVEGTKGKVNSLLAEGAQRVQSGEEAARACEGVFSQLAADVERVNAMLEDVNVSSREQASAVSEISKAIQQIDHATQATAQTTKEFLETSDLLAEQAQELFEAVSKIEGAIRGGRRAA